MNAPLLEQIAEAVLYEGYILYPYRPSSGKNRRERFTFGRVYPQAYSLAQGGAEPFVMQTECLVKTSSDSPHVRVTVRFLQAMAREIGRLEMPLASFPGEAALKYELVPELRVGDRWYQAWHEAVERTVEAPVLALGGEETVSVESDFRFASTRHLEAIWEGQRVIGLICRRQKALEGKVRVSSQAVGPGLNKVTVRLENFTPMTDEEVADPEVVLLRTFASTHTLLSVNGGEFVSLMAPPAETLEAARKCQNVGTWPVLVGDEASGECTLMLSSPIILYDYPKIAPESAGPLYDGTEIDELLTLRIQTLTDQEKAEMRHVDEQVRRLLERTENLPETARLRMHGAMRAPVSHAPVDFDDFFGANRKLEAVRVKGVELRTGDRVRICPGTRADVLDLALSGRTAVIEAIEQDLEKKVHLALVLENDPGKDLGLLRQTGHRFFYGLDEVEPIAEAGG